MALQVSLLLIRHGADVDVEDKEGYTVLGRASADFRPILIDAAKAMHEGWHLGVDSRHRSVLCWWIMSCVESVFWILEKGIEGASNSF